MTDNEIWKTIEEYETYSISKSGNVRNNVTGRILNPSKDTKGYFNVGLSKNKIGKTFKVHRLIALAFIENPENKKCVDHIDGNPQNNNISNLRFATTTENARNTKIKVDNTSGIKGVCFNKATNKWQAQIRFDGKRAHLGYFETIEEAAAARQIKANKHFGEFVNNCEKI
jgi:hypothetical protein